MRRLATRSLQTLIDVTTLAACLVAAFAVRFEGEIPPSMWQRLLVQLPYVVAAEYLLLFSVGAHRFSWRHISLRDVTRIFVAVVASAVLFSLARALLGHHPTLGPYLTLPWGVIAANGVLAFLGVGGVRVARRLAGESADSARRQEPNGTRTRTLLVGAGQAGHLVAREISVRPDLGILPVGFVDDDPMKKGSLVHGLPVLGTIADLGRVAVDRGATQVLITIAAAPGDVVRRIKTLAHESGLPTKIIPGVYEIVGGQVNIQRIRPVAIEDLLRREPVTLELDQIAESLRGRTVLVTGAGGSIGSELCRQVGQFAPDRLVLAERSENALFQIHRELQQRYPDLALVPVVLDITDETQVERAFADMRPEVVFHAAAHKHVPMMEWNPAEAVLNNVFGTKVVADAAARHEAATFVMISTDKAVNPTSVMGVTKRVAEMYVQSLADRARTTFVTVRFGNVLGSAGSVVPIFQEQIAAGGPVKVTHPEMVRYFMTIPEACQLVLQSSIIGRSGEILVLDMGAPVKIVDLARDLIRLSGVPEGDVAIEFTGTRPGEKLFEELSVDEESVSKTRHEKIYVGKARTTEWTRLATQLEALRSAAMEGREVRSHLKVLVPEYTAPPRTNLTEQEARPHQVGVVASSAGTA